MKKEMKKKLIIFGIALVVIAVGIVMACTLKFNRSLEFGSYTNLNVYMKEQSNLDDVRQIVSEVFSGKYEVEYTDEFYDTVSIKLKDITDEQLQNIKDKLVEKYGFDEIDNYIIEIDVPAIRIFDLGKDYIAPIVLSFVIIFIYNGIAFRKLGIYKSVIEPLITIIIIGALYVSILAICRIPINEYTIPVGIFIYIMSLLGITANLNNKSKNFATEKKK